MMGITTALQLADMSPPMVRKQFSVVLEHTVRELNGIACLGLEEFAAPKEQIVCPRSLGKKPTDRDSLRTTTDIQYNSIKCKVSFLNQKPLR
ncbi:hypothetical protein [Serratia sp. CY85251]|uniref:hypothetical protein n=1 Tax=Serratia sp. CY85251 TaxID=3383696 RepID=UPI003FA12808